jgi:hypothetical protein
MPEPMIFRGDSNWPEGRALARWILERQTNVWGQVCGSIKRAMRRHIHWSDPPPQILSIMSNFEQFSELRCRELD